MTRTDNLNLPQWVEEDPFQRADFNDAFLALDEGYGANAEACAAAYGPDNKPYVVGTYSSSSSANTEVNLGFRPSFLIIGGQAATTAESYACRRIGITDGTFLSGMIAFTDTGFTVKYTSSTYYPALNNGAVCCYIAFR